jgi:hypothetical protein
MSEVGGVKFSCGLHGKGDGSNILISTSYGKWAH